ncbi:MAG: hypothetical protein L0H53_09325 [Candidatus Nitrosocosmicus sp.]|nr:hypothetical protein [Candidatus Nitrosocosmicus sp.]
MTSILKQTKLHIPVKNSSNTNFGCLILLLMIVFTSASLLDFLNQKKVLAQDSSVYDGLKLNIQVTNNRGISDIGSIHVMADGTGISRDSNGVSFPAGQTVIQMFEFSSEEIPLGASFTTEVIYGDDHSKRVYGVNSQTSHPEIISISVP